MLCVVLHNSSSYDGIGTSTYYRSSQSSTGSSQLILSIESGFALPPLVVDKLLFVGLPGNDQKLIDSVLAIFLHL